MKCTIVKSVETVDYWWPGAAGRRSTNGYRILVGGVWQNVLKLDSGDGYATCEYI